MFPVSVQVECRLDSATPSRRNIAVNVSETLRGRWESRLHLAYLHVYRAIDKLRSTLKAETNKKATTSYKTSKRDSVVLAAEFNGKIMFDAVLSPEHVFELRTGEIPVDVNLAMMIIQIKSNFKK